MKLYSTNSINALGLTGPEQTHKHFPQAKLIKVDNSNIQESQQTLYQAAKKIFANSLSEKSTISQQAQSDKQPTSAKRQTETPKVFLGGDHSISYPIIKSFAESHPNPFLIIFDAHPDCMPHSPEPTHEEFLEAIISNGFPPEKIILIGIRKTEPEEQTFLNKHKIKTYKTLPDFQQILPLIQNHDLYISIDIDALDPKFAPAVNYPEPNGLNKTKFLNLLKQLLQENPKTIDIVEYCPNSDQNNKTLNLIKKIIQTINT